MKNKTLPVLLIIFLLVLIVAGNGVLAFYKIFLPSIAIVLDVIFAVIGVASICVVCARKNRHEVSPENVEHAESSKNQMVFIFDQLKQKAASLNEDNASSKQLIEKLYADVSAFVISDDVAAIKLEHDLFTKLTEVSSACDRVLSGSSSDELKKQLSSLETLVRQRQALTAN